MAALVENLFYVSNEQNERFKPWHGLGTPVKEAPTSKDAIICAGLDWKVESKPIYDAYGNVIPGYKANTRDKDNSILGIVTDKYKIVQNLEAFEFTDSLLEEEVRYETAGSLRDGKTVWLLAKMPERKILDDAFEPYICFTNNHEGTGAIRVCMTDTRVVCNNTLNLALNTAKRMWSTRHMGNIQEKLAEARHTLQLANTYNDELELEANRMVEQKISDAELEVIFDTLFPIDKEKDSDRKINNISQLKENLFRCYDMPDIKQYRGTAWGIINAVSDNVCHVAPNRMTSSYQENNWGKIMNGHPLLDNFYKALKNVA